MTAFKEVTGAPHFWRDEAMPFLEARSVQDGRRICYGPHAHETFSMGAINGGRSVYANGLRRQSVGAGSVVVVNPQDTHACNPLDDTPWSYIMVYVDAHWLAKLQHELGWSRILDFHMFSTTCSHDQELHLGLNRLFSLLTNPGAESLQKHSAVITFFSHMQAALSPSPKGSSKREGHDKVSPKLVRLADYIRENRSSTLTLDDMGRTVHLSNAHLIRAFKRHFGTTPHAYLVSCRVELAKTLLKRGHAIADVAAASGFSDQAHLQRVFKQLVAATPGQFRT